MSFYACGILVLLWLLSPCIVAADMWKGNKPPAKSKMDAASMALRLEQQKGQIDYYLANLHEKAGDLDKAVVRDDVDHKYITYCLIAKKYYWYGDRIKSAEYFYKDWLDQKELLSGTTGPIPWDCGHSDADSLSGAMSLWEENHAYAQLLAHYPELYDRTMREFSVFSKTSLIKTNFAEYERDWPMEAKRYRAMIQGWKKAEKLAKTTKPKPLDPAVQHHEWFYSDKQEEVLKALAYYHEHKVNFMLEKALKHKDPVIAAKGKEYLDRLGKVQNNAEKAK